MNAEHEFRMASKVNPKNGEPLFNLGVVKVVQGQLGEAFQYMAEAEMLDPSFGPVVKDLQSKASKGTEGDFNVSPETLSMARDFKKS